MTLTQTQARTRTLTVTLTLTLTPTLALRAGLSPEEAQLAATEHTMLLASVRTCCLRGATGPQGAAAPPLPYPTAASMLVG